MALHNTILTDTAQPIFTSATAPDGDLVAVMYFCNTSNNPCTITVHAVPNGDSPATDNIIYYDVQIASKDTFVVDMEKIMLGVGDSLHASANISNVVTCTVSTLGA